MKILITGATGFVGTWVTKKLLDQGHSIRILSQSGKVDFPFDSKNIEICRGDICDPNNVLNATTGVHSVFHLAGVVAYSLAQRTNMYRTNVEGTQNIINACAKSKCSRLVHLSSVVAVGANFSDTLPMNENSEFNLHHLNLGYFETKLAGEKLVLEAVRDGKIDAVILNPSTIYGPGDAKKGSRSTQVKVARGQFPFYTSGGVNVIHIQDAVNAIYRAWEVGRSGERYILSGENIRIQKLFQYVAAAANVNPPKIYLPNSVVLGLGRIGDCLEKFGGKGPINTENAWASILFHWFDNSKAKLELDLKTRPAVEAINESVFWMRHQGLLK